MSIKGITFNGKHSYRDMDITMTGERTIGYPNKRKIKVAPPLSNITYDFSELYGDQVYEERTLTYRFNMVNYHELDYASVQHEATKVVNWLMNSNGKKKLFDPDIKGYYFLAEVEGGVELEHFIRSGVLNVTFIAYPFKISVLPEGHDIWDEFNFELDMAQNLTYSMDGEYTFKQLPIGSTATIGAWATTYASGGGKIPLRNIGISGTITAMERVESSRSKRAYEVTGIDGLVVEQDVIQAHINPLETSVFNTGTPSITPKIDLTAKATIVKGNRSYNFLEGGQYENDDFRLDSGENKLKIYSFHKNEIEFNFHKELI